MCLALSRGLYWHIGLPFSFSCIWYIWAAASSLYESALGWHTRASKNAEFKRSQKLPARISNRASGAWLAPLFRTSPVMSCRTSSIWTSWQTMLSISASKSRSSLWCWILKPPFRQTMAWSMLKSSLDVPVVSKMNCVSKFLLIEVHVEFCRETHWVFRAISRSHNETKTFHGKKIHRPMEYTFLEYFHFCLAKLVFWRQLCGDPQFYSTRHGPHNHIEKTNAK